MKTTRKIYESKNYFESLNMMEILNNLPEEVEWNDVKIIPVYTFDKNAISVMTGFKFVAYKEINV